MPELPDVERFKRYIDATALHKRVVRAEVLDAEVLEECSATQLERCLADATFEKTRRHGKYMGVQLDGGGWLILHFGMTGYPKYAQDEDGVPSHTRLNVHFDNGYRLAYVNQRKLGRVRLVDDFDHFIGAQGLGPDALDIGREAFSELLANGRGTVKTRLMNQGLIAGLGNVYTDELLFQAGVHPGRGVGDVSAKESDHLWRRMRHVLRAAIDRQADPGRYPDTWLTPHRDEEECPRCHGALRRSKIAGRTSHYCPSCQS